MKALLAALAALVIAAPAADAKPSPKAKQRTTKVIKQRIPPMKKGALACKSEARKNL